MKPWTLERLNAIDGHKLTHEQLLRCENDYMNAYYRLILRGLEDADALTPEIVAEVHAAIPCQDGTNEYVEV